jgi:hypothetical protein
MNNEKKTVTVEKNKPVLLNKEWAVKLAWKEYEADLIFKIFAQKEKENWSVHIEVSGRSLQGKEKIEKKFAIQEGQHLMVGYYESDAYMRPYNLYLNLTDVLNREQGILFSRKNEPLCSLDCFSNGVAVSSPVASLQVLPT